jgi:hypoxanthine-guanine phosphoribosyltransferase
VLLEKPGKRAVTMDADYVGFTCPDVFVVGYGMDVAPDSRMSSISSTSRPRTSLSTSRRIATWPEDTVAIGKRAVTMDADYVGFTCPDVFVVGYGMDVAHAFRRGCGRIRGCRRSAARRGRAPRSRRRAGSRPGPRLTTVLLEKPGKRAVTMDADYVGFTCPDVFVVGYFEDVVDQQHVAAAHLALDVAQDRDLARGHGRGAINEEIARAIASQPLENLLVVAVLKGSFMFAADLIRQEVLGVDEGAAGFEDVVDQQHVAAAHLALDVAQDS